MFCLEPAQFCISESTKRVDVSWRFLHLQFWSFFRNKSPANAYDAYEPIHQETIQPSSNHDSSTKNCSPKNLTSKIFSADNVTPEFVSLFFQVRRVQTFEATPRSIATSPKPPSLQWPRWLPQKKCGLRIESVSICFSVCCWGFLQNGLKSNSVIPNGLVEWYV